MASTRSEIAPEEIRAIRQGLGLSQVAAGELLGGGPRAFTKYESGSVRPAASVINLLRLLEADPTVLEVMTGRKSRPMSNPVVGPFEVTAEHVAALTERTLPSLLQRLLGAEADAECLPDVRIHVATRIHTPDGGEDGRITWSGGPERTRFLPSRFCSFELKSGEILPSQAKRMALTKSGAVKDMVRKVVEADGVYVVVCAHPYVQREVDDRAEAIRKALRDAGLEMKDAQVEFRDAEQIVEWTNRHATVATWLKEKTQPGTLGPFRSWSHWAGRVEHDGSQWVEDERLSDVRTGVLGAVAEPRSAFRIVGPSGIGKSRLALEALGPTVGEEETGRYLSDLVLYADESEYSAEAINRTVQRLADGGQRAIVVVDRCPMESHRILSDMVSRSGSRLSLITLDEEVPRGELDKSTFRLADAPPSVIDAIVDRDLPGENPTDRRRIAHFSQGFPKIAIQVGKVWAESRPVVRATDDDLVNAFVLGRRPQEHDRMLEAASLLAAFGVVHREDPDANQMSEIASRGRGLTARDLHAAFEKLIDRGAAQRRGRAVVLQPRPIAMNLNERQWREWTPEIWEDVLTGDGSPTLKAMAARQLALLNTTSMSAEIVKRVCRLGGPFDGFEGISRLGHTRVLSSLAEIDSEVVAEQIERSLDDVDDLRRIEGDARRDLVWALEKIAFRRESFEDGAQLLLRLALAENETWGNNATGQFQRLFPVVLGDTEADGRARLRVLDDAADTDDRKRQEIVVDALIDGSRVHHHSRFVGPEIHGSRPALESWRPPSREEATTYVTGCVTRLAAYAVRDDDLGKRARTGLARNLRGLLGNRFIDAVETVVREVRTSLGAWPESLEGLGHFLLFDAKRSDPDIADRVRTLITDLEPQTLEGRVRHLVTEMPYDYACEEELDFAIRNQRQLDAVREVAAELAANPAALARVLPQLSRGPQRQVHVFGRTLVAVLDSPLDWLEPMVSAFVGAPEEERNCDLLAAFVGGMAERYPDAMEAFKQRAAQSPELAPALPLICFRVGITASDIPLAVGSLESGLLPPERLMQWAGGRAMEGLPVEAIAPLFDSLLGYSAGAFAIALDLMGMYAHGDLDKFEGLRPQLRKSAESVMRWKGSPPYPMAVHHFEQLMARMLERGRSDAEARATALHLAMAVVHADYDEQDWFAEPVVALLLSEFPEIAWPLIGQAIVSEPQRAWRMENVLGGRLGTDREKEAMLLQLPEDTLFAWCHAHPDRAPEFVAGVVPPLTTYRPEASDRSLHPVMVRLLDEFGDRDDVLQAVVRRMHTFGWWGSLTGYFALYEQPLSTLLDHPKAKVRHWAKATLRGLSASIESARNQDEERDAKSEV